MPLSNFLGNTNMPSPLEIAPHGTLDEIEACRNFGGKNIKEAEALFQNNPLSALEDLMWMGPIAFRYYVQAAINYFTSDAAKNEPLGLMSFAGVLEFRLTYEPNEIHPIAEQLMEFCEYIIEHQGEYKMLYDIDSDISRYKDLRLRFEKMLLNLTSEDEKDS